jgi:hypothetical protein
MAFVGHRRRNDLGDGREVAKGQLGLGQEAALNSNIRTRSRVTATKNSGIKYCNLLSSQVLISSTTECNETGTVRVGGLFTKTQVSLRRVLTVVPRSLNHSLPLLLYQY